MFSFFQKKRHGSLEEIVPGRKYRWIIPNILEVRTEPLNSPKSKSFQGTSFHFHLMSSTTQTVGFYIHYKAAPIPKYTYNFESCSGECLKQHTAHSIPPKTSRCGHWNVCSMVDIEGLQRRSNSEVIIITFQFDEDTTVSAHNTVQWTVPRFSGNRLFPLCSGAFSVACLPAGTQYHIRVDGCRDSPDEGVVQVTTRRGNPPKYQLSMYSGGPSTRKLLMSYQPGEQLHDFSGIPRFRVEDIKEACGVDGALVVEVKFEDQANPIAFLNNVRRASSGSFGGVPTDLVSPVRTTANIQEGGENQTYDLIED
eukprot:PhF_6_TR36079/c0_g1_i1/m.52415